MEGGGGAVGMLARSNQGNSSSLQHFWLRAAAGAGGGASLKQDTVGFLFCLLLFHWRFPIYLSDQVIEDIEDVDL